MGLSYLIEVTSYTFMALFISRFGTTTLAGHQIADNLGAVLYMTPLSIGIASSTLVSQALGALKYDEARSISRHSIGMACVLALAYGVILLAAAPARDRGLYAGRQRDRRRDAARAHHLLLPSVRRIADHDRVRAARLQGDAGADRDLRRRAMGHRAGGRLSARFRCPRRYRARGFWIANSLSLGVAGTGLLLYWRRVSLRHVSTVNAD